MKQENFMEWALKIFKYMKIYIDIYRFMLYNYCIERKTNK